MATVAICPLRDTPTPPPPSLSSSQPVTPMGSPPNLPLAGASIATTPVPIPNKHMPNPCSGAPSYPNPVTPPASPPSDKSTGSEGNGWMPSLLYPADDYPSLFRSPPVRSIDAAGVAAAVGFMSRQPLPDIDQIFPWAHGLHTDNAVQLAFLSAHKRSRRAPACFRGICIVRVGGDLNTARLKGAIVSEEILPPNPQTQGFLVVDPREGFNVRNFHIQVGKFACLSDIIVYGDDDANPEEINRIAKRISAAQLHYRAQFVGHSHREFPVYSTFIVQSTFSVFEELFPEMVVVDSRGNLTGQVVDFYHWERMEMCSMSRASEIADNVWLGSTADIPPDIDDPDTRAFHLLIEASDLAQMPSAESLKDILEIMEHSDNTPVLEFPGSGTMTPPSCGASRINALIDTCRWIHGLANEKLVQFGSPDSDGDLLMAPPPRGPRKILIHCTDGYTETSLLALAYLMYAGGRSAHEAWIYLHTEKKRNFFAYENDLHFLRHVEIMILEASARDKSACLNFDAISTPEWSFRMDGSLPSRILSYMYLGNLQHANNPGLLVALGIKRVLSIGEELSWTAEETKSFGAEKAMIIRDLQDNGNDPLEYQFRRCLDFIDEGHTANEPILVHCRVGVSRSATICIAEVMRSLQLSLPRAYCYVRARRLNVIIQPHLRFMYELLKFEESLPFKNCHNPKRELEWMHVAREIAMMNRPYTRQYH